MLSLFPFRGSDAGVTEDETVTLVKHEEHEAGYTEHTGLARYVDGEEREFAFDAMAKTDNGIVLKNYVDYTVSVWDHDDFEREAFIVIPWNSLKDFETIERTEKSLTYETRMTSEIPREQAEHEAQKDGVFIEEDRDD